MAYMNSVKTAEVRNELKKEFPSSAGWKFSVRFKNYSTLCVVIISAPFDYSVLFSEGYNYVNINHYHMDTYLKKLSPEAGAVLTKIKEIGMAGNHDNSDIYTDYFDVGWYFNLSIGNFEKSFTYVPTTPVENIVKEDLQLNTIEIRDYSEKALVILGDTKNIKDILKANGGKYNPYLTCGKGWIFPKTKKDFLVELLKNI